MTYPDKRGEMEDASPLCEFVQIASTHVGCVLATVLARVKAGGGSPDKELEADRDRPATVVTVSVAYNSDGIKMTDAA